MDLNLAKMQSELSHQAESIDEIKEEQHKMSERFEAKFEKFTEQMTRIEKHVSKWDGAHWSMALMLGTFLLFVGWTFNKIVEDNKQINVEQSQDIQQNAKDIQELKIEIRAKHEAKR